MPPPLAYSCSCQRPAGRQYGPFDACGELIRGDEHRRQPSPAGSWRRATWTTRRPTIRWARIPWAGCANRSTWLRWPSTWLPRRRTSSPDRSYLPTGGSPPANRWRAAQTSVPRRATRWGGVRRAAACTERGSRGAGGRAVMVRPSPQPSPSQGEGVGWLGLHPNSFPGSERVEGGSTSAWEVQPLAPCLDQPDGVPSRVYGRRLLDCRDVERGIAWSGSARANTGAAMAAGRLSAKRSANHREGRRRHPRLVVALPRDNARL